MNVARPERLLAEIDENLIRRDLTAAQRAKLVAKRKAYEAVHPETKPTKSGGRNRRQIGDDADRCVGPHCGGRNSPSIHRILAGSFIGSTSSQLAHRRARSKPLLSTRVVAGNNDAPQCTHRFMG
jgi:hypothetical protein